MPNINVARTTGGTLFLWNVDSRVGRGGPGISINNSLVQYLLFRCRLGSEIDPLLRRDQITGVWDPRSQSALKKYEKIAPRVVSDGVIDRMKPGQIAGSISNLPYKLTLLNLDFVRSVTGFSPRAAVAGGLITVDEITDILMRMPESDDMPAPLSLELKKVRNAGGFSR